MKGGLDNPYTDAQALAAAKAGAGVADGDLIQADATGLPAIDGSQLTGIGGSGGLYGINVETLTGDKTLTPNTDEIYQYLDEGGADRIITLATAGVSAGARFVIRHNGVYYDTHYLEVKQGATSLDKIYADGFKSFIFDGTNWISGENGTGRDTANKNVGLGAKAISYNYGVAAGYLANAYNRGAAVGATANAHEWGVAVGMESNGSEYGVAIGYGTYAVSRCVAIGYEAECLDSSRAIAIGAYSKTIRHGETSININYTDEDQENNVVQGRWEKETANATPVEMFCAGQANRRFTIRASSHLAFRITVVARDNVANEGAMYTFEGLIKRDAANNTVMAVCNKVVIHEDDAGWDCAVTADDTNEALIITVTGDADNPVQWAVAMNGVETHF